MKKYWYRIKNIPELRNVHSQKIEGFRVTKRWILFPKKLKLKNLVSVIEEKIEQEKPKTKKDYYEVALEKGFTEEELKDKNLKQLKALLELEEEIDA